MEAEAEEQGSLSNRLETMLVLQQRNPETRLGLFEECERMLERISRIDQSLVDQNNAMQRWLEQGRMRVEDQRILADALARQTELQRRVQELKHHVLRLRQLHFAFG